MKKTHGFLALLLALVMLFSVFSGAEAKTIPAGQTVGTVLFYITNSGGEQVLVSQIPVSEMESDMQAGKIDAANHNYSLLDRYVTTVHQEAQGFTVPEFVTYAQGKSTLPLLRDLSLTFEDEDTIRFWEIDQTGFDEYDNYTYNDLYGVTRYNFPLLYKYWNYKTQDYYDPDDKMTRDEVIDYIFKNGEPEVFLLSVRAFSQRYMVTDSKYGSGDYNMENLWSAAGLMDNERTIRLAKPMTKEELYSRTPTAADTRYWVANILLNMEKAPDFKAIGSVSAPTAVMTEDEDNYYIRFSCSTASAAIYYNHNYISPSYTPTCEYTGGAVAVPKSWFPSGTVTMTCRAVKDGYTDAGVVTLSLTSSGTETAWDNHYTDVTSDAWYFDAVGYVTQNGLFDATTENTFSPDAPTTRAMLVTALYRLQGSPSVTAAKEFSDVPATASYSKAVAWAYENGVVNGTSETTFSPDNSITREQIATMLLRYAEVVGVNPAAQGDTSKFSDAGYISDWAMDGMKWAVGMKFINGMGNGAVAPQGTATRAQVAQILYNYSLIS